MAKRFSCHLMQYSFSPEECANWLLTSDTDSYVRWCGRTAGEPASYPIIPQWKVRAMPQEAVERFFENIPPTFCDPITGIRPSSELEITAVLLVKHQLKKIDWASVRVRSAVNGEVLVASHVIGEQDLSLSEYPLFAKEQRAIDRWGLMTPDLIFMAPDISRVSIIEAKVDSEFTHGNTPPNGQASRYLEFLGASGIKDKSLTILCPEFNYEWYRSRLARASNELDNVVPSYIMSWEDLFRCVRG